MPIELNIVAARELVRLASDDDAAGPQAEMRDLGLDCDIVMHDARYGDSTQDLDVDPIVADKCDLGSMRLLSPEVYILRNCVIWSKYGLVLVGNKLVRESMFYFPNYLRLGVQFLGPRHAETTAIFDAEPKPTAFLRRAVTLLAGVQNNYYHWLMFVVPRIDPDIMAAGGSGSSERPIMIAPADLKSVQNETLEAMRRNYGLQMLSLAEGGCIHVEELIFPIIYRQRGVIPHPFIKRPLATLANALVPIHLRKVRRIYISRRDSNNRRLENEDEVERLLAASGFEIHTLTGMSVSQQITLFSSASHVVSPHGAGLTNIVFCCPGTKILEIHASTYINWCYRRLSAIYSLEYGCVFGHSQNHNAIYPHAMSYSIDCIKLASLLANKAFID